MTAPVLQKLDGGVLEITLNRPDRLNSFNDEMHAAMAAALDVAERDDACRAVLLTGAGRGFCAGQDLDARNPEKMSGPPDLGETLTRFYNPMIRRIRSLGKPVVCAVNGVAAGAGANLALACDIVLAAKSAKFIQSFVRVGLIPDAGGSWMLPRLIGEARAKAIAMTAEPLPAEKAEAWGMIWRVVEDADLLDEARALSARLATGPTAGLGRMKDLIQHAAGQDLDAHLDMEAEYQREAGRSADYAEGVRAFLEKREPKSGGRRMSAISDQERAERSSEAMLRDDHTTKGFGMKIESVGPGVATISMVVRKDHLNGHGTCHGGAIFTLADSAFAFACNSHNKISVAQHCSVTFLAPGREGDRLIAKAREVTRAGRSGVYDVTVMREDEAVIAEFRGLSRTISGTHFEETAG